MQIKSKSESVDLAPELNSDIFLTVTVGNAQIGGSIVRFEDGPIIGKGDIQNLNLGKGSDLIGETLKVVTNILDVNEQTNGMVVTYFFSSCTPPAFVFFDRVDNDGDIFSFEIKFNFQ